MDGIMLNGTLTAFQGFVNDAYKEGGTGGNTIAYANGEGKVTVASSRGLESGNRDKVYAFSRDVNLKFVNNSTRIRFYNAIVEQFGGDASKIPEDVKYHMKLKDYGGLSRKTLSGGYVTAQNCDFENRFNSGRPLDAERVKKVLDAIAKDEAAHPEGVAERLFQKLERIMLKGGSDASAKMCECLKNFFERMSGRYGEGEDRSQDLAKIEDICGKLLRMDEFDGGLDDLNSYFSECLGKVDAGKREWFQHVFDALKGHLSDRHQVDRGAVSFDRIRNVLVDPGEKPTDEICRSLKAFVDEFDTSSYARHENDFKARAEDLARARSPDARLDALDKLNELLQSCLPRANDLSSDEAKQHARACRKMLFGFMDRQREAFPVKDPEIWGKALQRKYQRLLEGADSDRTVLSFLKDTYKEMFRKAYDSSAKGVPDGNRTLLANYGRLDAIVHELLNESAGDVRATENTAGKLWRCVEDSLSVLERREGKAEADWARQAFGHFLDITFGYRPETSEPQLLEPGLEEANGNANVERPVPAAQGVAQPDGGDGTNKSEREKLLDQVAEQLRGTSSPVYKQIREKLLGAANEYVNMEISAALRQTVNALVEKGIAEEAAIDESLNSKNGVSALAAKLDAQLTDKEFTDRVAKEDFGFQKLNDDMVEMSKGASHACQSDPFVEVEGESGDIVETLHRRDPQGKVCKMIYADMTAFLCKYNSTVKTQEEVSGRDTAPDALGHVIGNGYVTRSSGEWHYNETGPNPLDGWMIRAKQKYAGNQRRLDSEIETDMLFGAMPCLAGDKDRAGALKFLCRNMELCGRTLTAQERANAAAFVKAFLDAAHSPQTGLKEGPIGSTYYNGLMLLQFCGPSGLIAGVDVFSGDTKQNVDRLMKLARKDPNQDQDLAELLGHAKRNYENTLRMTFRRWITGARKRGDRYFLGGPLGCGSFGNDPKIVSRIWAEEFVAYGGDMKFVYDKYGRDVNAQSFKDAFKEALRQRNVAMNDPVATIGPVGTASVMPNVKVNTDIPSGDLGKEAALGDENDLMGDQKRDNVLESELLAELQQNKGTLNGIRSAYAMTLNSLSRKLKFFNMGKLNTREKGAYLKFLKKVDEILENPRKTLEALKTELRKAMYESTIDRGLTMRITQSLETVEKFYKEQG